MYANESRLNTSDLLDCCNLFMSRNGSGIKSAWTSSPGCPGRIRCVPCYAGPFLLDKFFVHDMEEVTQMTAYLRTKYGFSFKCTIYNEVDHTYFGRANWKGLTKAYGLEPHMKITFDVGTYSLSEVDIWVDLEVMPILPPLDGTYYTARRQKLPRCVVPLVMDDHQGDMTIISIDKIYFRGTYLITPDGKLEINEWRQLLSDCNMKIGDRWISVLHHANAWFFLFFKIVPKGEEFRTSSYNG
ncbi:hypothetical protein ZWY2020_006056 [Hordeum vulgare]|nr:hypothetical protein ZWY2020_006056 [Hordeum vulgare]